MRPVLHVFEIQSRKFRRRMNWERKPKSAILAQKAFLAAKTTSIEEQSGREKPCSKNNLVLSAK